MVLLQCGADHSIPFHNGYTPLHVAASTAHVGITLQLLHFGANAFAQDSEGATPLSVAWDIPDPGKRLAILHAFNSVLVEREEAEN